MVAQGSKQSKGKAKGSRMTSGGLTLGPSTLALSTSTSKQAATRIASFVVVGCEKVYRDYASVPISIVESHVQSTLGKRKGPRGGVTDPFPVKLYTMLEETATTGYAHVVSWQQPHGRCFMIHHSQAFVDEIMPRFFNQSKYTSFQRQLNLYGFHRVASGPDRSCYYHPLLLRGRPDLCRLLLRTRVKGGPCYSGEELLWQSLLIRGDCSASGATAAGTLSIDGRQRMAAASSKLGEVTFEDLPPCVPTQQPKSAGQGSKSSRVRNVSNADRGAAPNAGSKTANMIEESLTEEETLEEPATFQVDQNTFSDTVLPNHVESSPNAQLPVLASAASSEAKSQADFPLFPDLSQASTFPFEPPTTSSMHTATLAFAPPPLPHIAYNQWVEQPANDATSPRSASDCVGINYRASKTYRVSPTWPTALPVVSSNGSETSRDSSVVEDVIRTDVDHLLTLCESGVEMMSDDDNGIGVNPFENSGVGFFEGQSFRFMDDEHLRLYETNIIGM